METRNRSWPRLARDDALGEAAYKLNTLLDGKERIYSSGANMTSERSAIETSATIRMRPESLITSDRSLACSDHGENQRQRKPITVRQHTCNISAVRAIPGRSFNTTRCRFPDCNETETLGHVYRLRVGIIPKGELLGNA